jgi:hypothetical protein
MTGFIRYSVTNGPLIRLNQGPIVTDYPLKNRQA